MKTHTTAVRIAAVKAYQPQCSRFLRLFGARKESGANSILRELRRSMASCVRRISEAKVRMGFINASPSISTSDSREKFSFQMRVVESRNHEQREIEIHLHRPSIPIGHHRASSHHRKIRAEFHDMAGTAGKYPNGHPIGQSL